MQYGFACDSHRWTFDVFRIIEFFSLCIIIFSSILCHYYMCTARSCVKQESWKSYVCDKFFRQETVLHG